MEVIGVNDGLRNREGGASGGARTEYQGGGGWFLFQRLELRTYEMNFTHFRGNTITLPPHCLVNN